MILKHLQLINGRYTWSYIDGFKEVQVCRFTASEALEKYDAEVSEKKRDPVVEEYEYTGDIETGEFTQGKKLPDATVRSNKIFVWVSDQMTNEFCQGDHHDLNAVSGDDAVHSEGVSGIYLHYSNGERGTILVTNQTAYLLNDTGKTIERIF